MKRSIMGLLVVLAVAFVSVPTLLSAPALAADRTASYSISGSKDDNGLCTAYWSWYQGAALLSSGSVSGSGLSCSTVSRVPARLFSLLTGPFA